EGRILFASISGAAFGDYNSNGIRDSGEPGLSGWTVFLDSNNNGVLDNGETQTTSDASGSWRFDGVADGQYTVREVVPPGWTQTIPLGRPALAVESASQPSTGPAAQTPAARPVTDTEVMVAFSGSDGMASLGTFAHDLNIGGLFDLQRSRPVMSIKGANVISVALRSGVSPASAVARFSSLAGVKWAQPDYIYDQGPDPRELTPNDPSYSSQYHHPLMQDNLAWDYSTGSGVVIAITDDGLSLSHPDLAPNVWVNPGEIPGNGIDDDGNGFVDDVNGWDFSSNDNDPNPAPGFSHGTHVAGIVAARTNNGIGVAGTAGEATIMPIRFYGSANWTSLIVAESFKYAADNGAKILSDSYNIDSFVGDPLYMSAIQYVYDHGMLYLNSAGNSNLADTPRQTLDQVLLVANTMENDAKQPTSNYGYGIDLSAPGTNILSTLPDNTYGLMTGTSMAAPNAAGVAALIWSEHPTWTRNQVAAQLIGTTDNIDAANPGYVGLLGSGRVNGFRAVSQTLAPPRIKSLAGLPAAGSSVFATSIPSSFTLDVASVFDPATVTGSSFDLRGDGLDDTFGTADDTLVPLTLNTASYAYGTNRLSFSVAGGTMLPDTYRFSALPALHDPFGHALDGNSDGVAGDAFTRVFNILGSGQPYSALVVGGVDVSGLLFGDHDVAPPRLLATSFEYQTRQAIDLTFSEDVSATLDAADLLVTNITTGQPILPGQIQYAGFDSTTNTASFTFISLANASLPNGNYTVSIIPAGISDPYSNLLSAASVSTPGKFFVLAGDANRDRAVDETDLGILAAHWEQPSPATFGEGDFNYDGRVDVNDLNILAINWQQVLAVPTTSPAAPARTLRRPVTRVADSIFPTG
ncbi:MAG TPA: S8 family serine peptidase, partial [Tepidisphaeraceae bacterium]